MAQAHKGTVTRPGANTRPQFVHATKAILAVVAAAVTVALLLPALAPQAAAPTRPITNNQAIVDGWMPAAAAAQTARLQRVQDGSLSGLLLAQPAIEAVDGWTPSLLSADSAAAGAYEADPRDGWER